VKTGTARGIIDPESGASKSAVAYNGSKGSIAVIECTEVAWIPTITAALETLKNLSPFAVQNGTQVAAQPNNTQKVAMASRP
jgi:hypothetical protein